MWRAGAWHRLALCIVETDWTAEPVNMTGQTKHPTTRLAFQQGANTNYFVPLLAHCAMSCAVCRLSGEARWWGPGLVGYRVTPSRPDCAGLVRGELQYVNRVRRLQQQRDEEAAGR